MKIATMNLDCLEYKRRRLPESCHWGTLLKTEFVKLVVEQGPRAGEEMLFHQYEVFVVGRAQDAQLHFPENPRLSRYHCRFDSAAWSGFPSLHGEGRIETCKRMS